MGRMSAAPVTVNLIGAPEGTKVSERTDRNGQRRVDVVELVVLARAIGFDPFEVLAIVEAATEPDHRI